MPTSNKWKVWRIMWSAFNTTIGITALCISLFFSTIPIKSETYIGVMATLIGACATFIVINQIISYTTFKNAEKKITDHELHIKEMRIVNEAIEKRSEGNLFFSQGFAMNASKSPDYITALISFYDALNIFLDYNKNYVQPCIKNIKHCVGQAIRQSLDQKQKNKLNKNNIPVLQVKIRQIKKSSNFLLIEETLNDLEKEIEQLIANLSE